MWDFPDVIKFCIAAHKTSEKAIRFRHPDYDPDRAQKLISSSMSRHLSTCNISSKSISSMHAFLSNLAHRQTNKRTRANAFTSSFVGDNNINNNKKTILITSELKTVSGHLMPFRYICIMDFPALRTIPFCVRMDSPAYGWVDKSNRFARMNSICCAMLIVPSVLPMPVCWPTASLLAYGQHSWSCGRAETSGWTRLKHNVPAAGYVRNNNTTSTSKGKEGKGPDTCYSATYMSQTHDQQRFTIFASGSWPAWANDAAVHYVAIHCPR